MRFSSLLAYAAVVQCAVISHVKFTADSASFDIDESMDIENTVVEPSTEPFVKRDDSTDTTDTASSINVVTNQNFIVIFKPSTSLEARDNHHKWLKENFLERTHSFLKGITADSLASNCKSTTSVVTSIENNIKGYINHDTIQGYYGNFSTAVIEAIRKSEEVAVVEQDSFDRLTADNFIYLQNNATWGLARISHKDYSVDPLTGMPSTNSDDENYVFLSSGGTNTTIYILDSGVNADHKEFTGRVRWGANFVDGNETDAVGHGSHVAGIAAGYNVGVAKFANVVSVKVIDADSRAPISRIIQGLSWIIDDHNKNPGQRSIINYSAVGAISEARSYVIKQATDAGILLVTAAGNSADDACSYGPADLASSNTGVIAVAASNYTDTAATFSNYGSCVTVYAPGVSILSASNDSTTGYKYMSGTSMASPFVAGLASYFWSQEDKQNYTSEQVRDLISNYNDGKLSNLPVGSPNKLAYNHL
jgi:cerevisin